MCKMILMLMMVILSTFVHAGERYFPESIKTEKDEFALLNEANRLLNNAKKNNDYRAMREMFEEYIGHAEELKQSPNMIHLHMPMLTDFYITINNEYEKKVYSTHDLFSSYTRNRIAADREIKGKSVQVLVPSGNLNNPKIESLEKGHYALAIRDSNQYQKSNMAIVCIFTPEKVEALAEYDPEISFVSIQGSCRGFVDSKYIVFDDCSIVRYFP